MVILCSEIIQSHVNFVRTIPVHVGIHLHILNTGKQYQKGRSLGRN